MRKLCGRAGASFLFRGTIAVVLLVFAVSTLSAETGGAESAEGCDPAEMGSPFIPVDSWIYPAVLRLHSLGYLDHVFVGLRPWTRSSVGHMLEDVGSQLEDKTASPARDQAEEIYNALLHELKGDTSGPCLKYRGQAHLESAYSVMRGISGTPLRDSFHLGSTIMNDYGRPYQNGFNNYTGMSGWATSGRFSAYVRGEFQGAPSGSGYSAALYQTLAQQDFTVNPVTGLAYAGQSTIPGGPIASTTQGRLLEAYVGMQLLNHVISFGKQDEWMGASAGGAMAYSNNAENIYALHVNRVEPLYIPFLSRLTGPFRYEFMVGELQGHTRMDNPLFNGNNASTQPNVISPGNPWIHIEKVSLRPTQNFEVGFERTAMFGGKGHSPVTLHSFLKSFFSLSAPMDPSEKYTRRDPGARFGAFDSTYRIPFLRNWLTLTVDGEVHDDVSPIDAPRRASWRPGLYLSHVPGLPRLDLRVEGITTDPGVDQSSGGRFMYWEVIERQGYTNQGQLFGDWVGREDKGGQAWATYHLSGNEWAQVSWRGQKADKDFVPGGTTLNDVDFRVVKRIRRDLEIDGNVKVEHWKAPVYKQGSQTVTSTTIQLTWYPERKVSF